MGPLPLMSIRPRSVKVKRPSLLNSRCCISVMNIVYLQPKERSMMIAAWKVARLEVMVRGFIKDETLETSTRLR